MNLIPAAVATKFGRPLLHLQKNSPQVMFAGGVAAALASTVLACRATLKLSDVLQEAETLKMKAEFLYEDGNNKDYTEKQYHKDLTVIKIKAALNVTKLYAPSAGLTMIAISLLTGSHVTLNRRNASLTAAYASVDQAFQQYRDRVKDRYGNDTDQELRYGSEKVKETVEGKTVTHTRVSNNTPSQYARFFDELCNDWKRNPEYNRAFLHTQQSYWNQVLQSRGHVFLNEVYDALGMPRSSAGAVVGWALSEGGDNFVDFGIFDDLTNPRVRDFVNGREYSILLDFNVDGVIYDKI